MSWVGMHSSTNRSCVVAWQEDQGRQPQLGAAMRAAVDSLQAVLVVRQLALVHVGASGTGVAVHFSGNLQVPLCGRVSPLCRTSHVAGIPKLALKPVLAHLEAVHALIESLYNSLHQGETVTSYGTSAYFCIGNIESVSFAQCSIVVPYCMPSSSIDRVLGRTGPLSAAPGGNGAHDGLRHRRRWPAGGCIAGHI
jgi:hypothetical protein